MARTVRLFVRFVKRGASLSPLGKGVNENDASSVSVSTDKLDVGALYGERNGYRQVGR